MGLKKWPKYLPDSCDRCGSEDLDMSVSWPDDRWISVWCQRCGNVIMVMDTLTGERK